MASTTLDPAPAGKEYACGRCGGPTRANLDTRERRCDLHPDATVELRDRRIPPLCWEIDREPVACTSCGRRAVWVLLHPPIPRQVLVSIDLLTEDTDNGACRGCDADLPVPDRFGGLA